ncbi:hypothetical protein RI543_003211 [Arxiozyma heterogenica]|uniref:RING-type domain-containing protein n=1 Tax=Arxiozyma heterogenica TaxID=278026 RepID=A0AAN8A7X6_9SACH|nr:hypothetical protein RI543_003211 [Kazachstania heterogenica]
MTHANILVEGIEFDRKNGILSLQDLLNFIDNHDQKTIIKNNENGKNYQPPRIKKPKIDSPKSINFIKITLSSQQNDSNNTVTETPSNQIIRIPIFITSFESEDILSIQFNKNWDSTKLFNINLIQNHKDTQLHKNIKTIILNKGRENLFHSLLDSSKIGRNQINPTDRRLLLTKLSKLKRLNKDWNLNNLNLLINKTDLTWFLELDLDLILKENSYNKFSYLTCQILDIVSSQYLDCNQSHDPDRISLQTNSNFIQKHFLKQTIRFTNNTLSKIKIDFYNNNGGDSNHTTATVRVPGLCVDLLPFQEESVQWMLNKETNYQFNSSLNTESKDPISLKEFLNEKISYGYIILNLNNRNKLYWNKFTNFILTYNHALSIYNDYIKDSSELDGAKGLLSDEMGLGKTIEIIALILLNQRKLTSSSSFLTQDNKTIYRSNSTLIICPDPLLYQWINEIEMHTDNGIIKCFNYKGYQDITQRFQTTNIEEIVNILLKYDLIITTYKVINLEIHYAKYNANLRSRRRRNNSNSIANNGPKYDYSSPLSLIQFWRIILDEVQMLKSDNTQIAKCTNLLHRIHTWGVSGTPIQYIRDFQTVLSYLQIYPFVSESSIILDIHNNFNTTLTRNGIKFDLNNLMNLFIKYNICIRHSKKDVINQIHLPKQTNFILPLDFNPIEWDNYLNLWNDFISVSGYGMHGQNETRLSNNQLNQWLVKLRYLCCHAIIPDNLSNILNLHNNKGNMRGRRGRKHSYDNQKTLTEKEGESNSIRKIDDVLVLMIEAATDTLDTLNKENIQLKIKSAQAAMELQNKPDAGIILLKQMVNKIKKDIKEKFMVTDDRCLKITCKTNTEKSKIRSYFDLLHQCYFFLGTGYYFLGSKKLEFVEEENEKIKILSKDSKEPLEFKKITDFYTEDELLMIKKMQVQETEYYQKAEQLRIQILSERANKVEEVISNVKHLFDSSKNKEAIKDSAKEQKKLITELQEIYFDKKNYSSNPSVSNCFDSLSFMINILNKQSVQFNALLKSLMEYLYNPVLKNYDENNEDKKAEEYNQSLEEQDMIFAILHSLEELLKNREIIVTSEEEIIKLNKKQFVKNDPTFSEFHSKLLKKLIIIDKGKSLKSIFNDLENVKIVRKSSDTFEKKYASDTYEDYLLQYGKEVSRMIKEIEDIKESIKTLNLIYNAKVEYYSQLQKISDSLISLIQLEPISRNNILKAIRDDNRFNDNTITITKVQSRIKYLKNLSKIKELIDRGESFNCAICLSMIHDGSIIKCGHFFCYDCIHNWLKNKKSCPICKIDTNQSELYNFKFKNKESVESTDDTQLVKILSIPNKNFEPGDQDHAGATNITSKKNDDILFCNKYERFKQFKEVCKIKIKEHFGAKIDFMIRLILYLKLKSEHEDGKSLQILIYSQNFEFLKVISKVLKINNISHLTCLTNVKTISNTIDKFKKDRTITCLLLNVKSLGAGLNLLNVEHIFLLDPIISHNEELQAMSRNYRIGQTKKTYVWNFMIRGTVEENIFRYKCILETQKNLSYLKQSHHEFNRELNAEPTFKVHKRNKHGNNKISNNNEDDEELEFGGDANDLVTDKHLWHCFFQT